MVFIDLVKFSQSSILNITSIDQEQQQVTSNNSQQQ